MTADLLANVLSGLLPYLAPIIFFVGASIVADKVIQIVMQSFDGRR